ncbi:uncharacterized protein LOC116180939 [Photinus pyralis]|uniref:Uncharacterized protein n=1 Tax=Photinus pyralis TaxID=7054 RepID=A0A1Y1NE60_PHOPY|nr:uncharacterized protein LOC116180939 [Photinus pyralis]
MSLVKSLVMEVRPRLQSVNVYVILAKADSVTVRLNTDHFELRSATLNRKVRCADFRIVPDSLSGLVCAGDQLTFRFGTENRRGDLGTLKCELLPTTTTDRIPPRKPFLRQGETYGISCAECSGALAPPIRFDSALPVPENGDKSDWFCHSHVALADLQPKRTQVLYGDYFAYLDSTVLQLVTDDSTLYCPQCSSWIGTREKGACKVWFNTANFGAGVENGALIDVIAMLKLCCHAPFSPVRVVLQCHDPRNPADVILLWIMERNLTLDIDDVKSIVAKVLFRVENKTSDLASEWFSNVNVIVYDVSKPMLSKLSEHLYDMGRYIPKDFNVSNDFNVSYILCNKIVQ